MDTNTKAYFKNTRTNEIAEIALPYTDDELEEVLNSIGCSIDPEEEPEWDDIFATDGGEKESEFDPFEINEIESKYDEFTHAETIEELNEINELVESIEDFTSYEEKEFEALIEDGDSVSDAINHVVDGEVNFYADKTLADVAKELEDDGVLDRNFLLQYIDWDAVGEALKNDCFSEVSGGVLERRY